MELIQCSFDITNPLHTAFLKWKETASEKDLTNAVVCGYTILTSPINSTEQREQRDKYEHQISQLNIQHTERIATLKREHSTDIEYYRQKIHENCEQWIAKYDQISKEYNAYIRNMADNMRETQKDTEIETLRQQINTLQTQLQVIQNTNSYKGEIGERQVKDILQQHFPACEIKDTSAQQSMSDIHLIDKDGYIIAIECKNKNSVTAQDVQKSMNDIKHIKTKYGELFVGYLFVSLKSNNIPKKGELCFEIINDIPTIWYGSPPNQQTLDNDVIKLIKILSMHQTYQSMTDNVSSQINSYLQKILEIKKGIDAMNSTMSTMKGNIQSLQSSIDWLYDDMAKLIGVNKHSRQPNTCPHCDAIYKRKGDLERHIQTKHM
jgi:hypothetical protein